MLNRLQIWSLNFDLVGATFMIAEN